MGTLLRIIAIYNIPLFFDEAHQILLSRSNDFILATRVAAEGHPPANLLLVRFWQLFSQNLIFIRIMPVVFGVLTIIAIALVAKKLFGNFAGLTAAFLVAISPSQIYYSSIARMYALATLESVFVTYFSIQFLRRKVGILPLTLSILAGLYTHFFFIIYLLVLNVYIFIFWRKTKAIFKRLLLSDFLIFLFSIPIMLLILTSERSFAVPANALVKLPFFYINPVIPWDLVLGLNVVNFGQADLLSIMALLLASITLILFFFGVFHLKKNNIVRFLSFVYMVPPILMYLFSFIFFRLTAVRSFIVFSPLFFLVVAATISNVPKRIQFLAIFIFTLLTSIFLALYSLTNFGSKNVFNQVYANFSLDDTVVYNDVLFYLPTRLLNLSGKHLLIHPGYLSDDAIKALDLKITQASELPKPLSRIWYVKKLTNWPPYDLVAENVDAYLATRYLEVKRINYVKPKFELILYQQKSKN